MRYYSRSANFPRVRTSPPAVWLMEDMLNSENLSEQLEFGTPLETSCASLFISLLLVSI